MNCHATNSAQTASMDWSDCPQRPFRELAAACDRLSLVVDASLTLPNKLPPWFCEMFGTGGQGGLSLHAAIMSLNTHPDESEAKHAIGNKLLSGRSIVAKQMSVRATYGWEHLSMTAEPIMDGSESFDGYKVIIDRTYKQPSSDEDAERKSFVKAGLNYLSSYEAGSGAHAAAFSVIMADCDAHLLPLAQNIIGSLFWLGSTSIVCGRSVLCVVSNYAQPEQLPEACKNLCTALERFIPGKKWVVGASTTQAAGTSLIRLIKQAQSSAAGAHQAGREFMIYEPSIPAVASIDFLAGSLDAQVNIGLLEIEEHTVGAKGVASATWIDARYGSVPDHITRSLLLGQSNSSNSSARASIQARQ